MNAVAWKGNFLECAPFIVDQVTKVSDHDETGETVAFAKCWKLLLKAQVKVRPPATIKPIPGCNLTAVLAQPAGIQE